MSQQVDRRTMLAGGLALSAVALTGATAPRAIGELIYIGMHGGKIHAARFDPQSGDLAMICPVADNARPTWAVYHPRLPIVYFVEGSTDEGKGQGGVQALRIDRTNGALTKLSDVRSGGIGTTHLGIDRRSNTIMGVNYNGAQVFALPVQRDGSLGEVASQVQVSGSGPNQRQASAHPHAVQLDPSGRWVVVPDLGADRIWVFPFDPATRQLGADDPVSSRHAVLPPGAGPRHIVFHPRGHHLYLVEELSANVSTFGWDARTGRLTPLQTLSTDNPAFSGTKSAAEIAVSRDGRFVYVSNRGDHALVVHAIDGKTGTLRQIQRMPSGGPLPWHFSLHRSGKWLLVANRDADALALFHVEPRTGMLRDSGKRLTTPKPVFASFSGISS